MKIKNLREESFVLSNGLRVILVPLDRQMVAITYAIGIGANHDPVGKRGISHYLEHAIFKGTENYPTAKDVARAMDSIGGVVNAQTGYAHTAVFGETIAADAPGLLALLTDLVFKPKLRSKDIETERGPILEEIAMYDEEPLAKLAQSVMSRVYKGHGSAQSITGTKADVNDITPEDIREHHRFYHPENMVLCVAGGIDEDLRDALASLVYAIPEREAPETPEVPIAKASKKGHLVVDRIKQSQVSLNLFFPVHADLQHPDGAARLDLLAHYLGVGSSSVLMQTLREERGLCYETSAHYQYEPSGGMFAVSVGVDKANLKEAFQLIVAALRKVTDRALPQDVVASIKKPLMSHRLMSEDFLSSVTMGRGLRHLKSMRYRAPGQRIEETWKLVQEVTPDQLWAQAHEVLNFDTMTVGVSGNVTKKEMEALIAEVTA